MCIHRCTQKLGTRCRLLFKRAYTHIHHSPVQQQGQQQERKMQQQHIKFQSQSRSSPANTLLASALRSPVPVGILKQMVVENHSINFGHVNWRSLRSFPPKPNHHHVNKILREHNKVRESTSYVTNLRMLYRQVELTPRRQRKEWISSLWRKPTPSSSGKANKIQPRTKYFLENVSETVSASSESERSLSHVQLWGQTVEKYLTVRSSGDALGSYSQPRTCV